MISKSGENLVFLLGLPRSGTTLLSVLLDAHPEIRCPPEPWIMLALESMGRTGPHNPADAPVLYRAFKQFIGEETAAAAAKYYALTAYNKALSAAKKKLLIDKTPRYYLILPYLIELFPKAQFIILWRNPLDIAASMQVTWQVDITAQLQRHSDHLLCIDLLVGLRRLMSFAKKESHRVLAVQYEQLVAEPLPAINGMLDWLGRSRFEQLPALALAGGEFDSHSMGDKKILNTTSPHTDSVGRWKQVFSNEAAAAIAAAIGPHIFSSLGYGQEPKSLELTDSSTDSSPSNTYADVLESSLKLRAEEYNDIGTYGDLLAQERQLLGLIHEPATSLNLLRNTRRAIDSIAALSAECDGSSSRANEMENALSAERARLSALTQETQNLRPLVARQEEANAAHASAIAELSRQIAEAKAAAGTARQEAIEHQSKSFAVSALLSEAQEGVKQWSRAYRRLSRQARGLSQHIEAIKDELAAKSAAIEQSQQQFHIAQQEISSLQQQRDSSRQQHESLSSQFQSLEQQRGALQQQRDSAHEQCDALRQQRDALKQQFDSLQQQRDAQQARITELAQSAEQCRREQDSQIAGVKEHLSRVETDARRLEGELKRRRDEVGQLENQIAQRDREMKAMAHTRLWRAASWAYPKYQRLKSALGLPLR